MVRSLALAVAVMASAAWADVPSINPEGCRSDRECVITSFEGCCEMRCCPPSPHAMSAAALRRSQSRCAVIDCVAAPCNKKVKCAQSEPESNFRAVCRAGTCEAQRVSESAQCRSDSECTVVYPDPPCSGAGPCGCCPGTTPEAVPVEEAGRFRSDRRRPTVPEPAPTPLTKKDEVKFGLTPGPGNLPPPPPNCSPCPGARPASARCLNNRCVIAPIPRPPG